MSEEILSSDERNEILGQVFPSKPEPVKESINTPKRSSECSEEETDLSQVPFGSLLEQTIAIREKQADEDKQVDEHIDESREQAIKLSRMDILDGWKL